MANRTMTGGVIALAGFALAGSILGGSLLVRPAAAQFTLPPPIHIKGQGPSALEFNLYGLNTWDRSIVGTRGRGMGGLTLALPGSSSSGGQNPAALATLAAPELSAESRSRGGSAHGLTIPTHITGDDGSLIEVSRYRPAVIGSYTYHDLSVGMPIQLMNRRAGLALAYHRLLDFPGGEETRMKVIAPLGEADLGQGLTYHGGVDALTPSIGFQVMSNLALGASLNFMSGTITENGNQGVTTFGFVVSRGALLFKQDVSGTSLDLGAQFRVGPNFRLGASVQPAHSLSFRHGFYSYQPLPTAQSATPQTFVFERTLLDHTLSIPSMWGLGGSYNLMNGRMLLGAEYWNRPWSKATYKRQDYDVFTLFPDSTSLANAIGVYVLKNGDVEKNANLLDTSHMRLGLEYMLKQNPNGGLQIPVRLGYRREPLTLANANPDSFNTLVAAIGHIAADTLDTVQKEGLISGLVSEMLQNGASLLLTDRAVNASTITFGSGLQVGAFSLDLAYSVTSFKIDRIFLGSFSDITISPRPQLVSEKHTSTEISLSTSLKFR